jgi:hypothetical protein
MNRNNNTQPPKIESAWMVYRGESKKGLAYDEWDEERAKWEEGVSRGNVEFFKRMDKLSEESGKLIEDMKRKYNIDL